jgi:hypothetical protein
MQNMKDVIYITLVMQLGIVVLITDSIHIFMNTPNTIKFKSSLP